LAVAVPLGLLNCSVSYQPMPDAIFATMSQKLAEE
jgi:hypothetical protein